MIQIAQRFLSAMNEHREAMRRIDARVQFWTGGRTTNPVPRFRPVQYFRQHIFSILFLAVYQHLGFSRERRVLYGVVNRCLRGIITGADNLLDDEYRPVFDFDPLPQVTDRYRSILSIMLSQTALDDALRSQEDQGAVTHDQAVQIKLRLASDMAAIGETDAAAPDAIPVIIEPDQIKAKAHESKGAKLLGLSLHAPRVVEVDAADAIDRAEEAIRTIGMGVQMLDDLTDVYEDVAAHKDNYLVSLVHHDGTPDERERLAREWSGQPADGPVELAYPAAARRVASECRTTVTKGLRQLNSDRELLRERDAQALLRLLFTVRGAGRRCRSEP